MNNPGSLFWCLLLIFASCKMDNNKSNEAVKDMPREIIDSGRPVHPSRFPETKIEELTTNILGVWQGNIPCKECDEISIALRLNEDYTYHLKAVRDQETSPLMVKGGFIIKNNVIILDHEDGEVQHYFIGDNGLYVMNQKKQLRGGDIKDDYLLVLAGY